MTGLERKEYLRNFYQAEERLRRAGFRKIVNPARLAPCRWPWLYRLIGYWWTIRYDLFWLRRCDMIYKLDGWQTSRGALIESAKAEKWNIKTLTISIQNERIKDWHEKCCEQCKHLHMKYEDKDILCGFSKSTDEDVLSFTPGHGCQGIREYLETGVFPERGRKK